MPKKDLINNMATTEACYSKYVEDAIASIKSNIQEGDSVTMDIGKNDTELNIKITSPKKSEEQ